MIMHQWVDDKAKEMKCRYDWHQTASHVTVAISRQEIQVTQKAMLNLTQFRLIVHLNFPERMPTLTWT